MSRKFVRVRSIRLTFSLSLIVSLAPASRIWGGEVQVDVQPYVNANLQSGYGYANGSHYPSGGTTLSDGNATFTLAYFDPVNTTGTGALQTGSFNPMNTNTFDVKVNIANPDTVYTLINSVYGVYGATVGSVEFKATGGLDYSVDLVEGQDIRDHNNDGANNVIGTGDLKSVYLNSYYFDNNQIRFDEQGFVLPASFRAATLTDIILNGSGNVPDGEPFLVAATVGTASVPEPSGLVIAIVGVGMVSAWGWGHLRRSGPAVRSPRN